MAVFPGQSIGPKKKVLLVMPKSLYDAVVRLAGGAPVSRVLRRAIREWVDSRNRE